MTENTTDTNTPYAIVVHSIEHARAALAAAEELDKSVVLLSDHGAVAFLGATVFRDMIAEAAKDHPRARYQAVLDCGDEPGLAMGAMRHGVKSVCVHIRPEVEAKLAENAEKRGCTVYHREGPELDLQGMSNPKAACQAWMMAL